MHHRLLPRLECWQVLDGGRVRFLQVCITVTCFNAFSCQRVYVAGLIPLEDYIKREEMPVRNVHLEMFATHETVQKV